MPAPINLKDDHVALDSRLGRLPSFDPRSRRYPARALLAEVTGQERPPLRSYSWAKGSVFDQGQEGSCVGHAHGGRIASAPDVHREIDHDDCVELYHEAQEVDEWPGADYEGTSVLAGAKVATAWGRYTSYSWGFSIEDALLAIGYLAPVVAGTYWLDGMFRPRPSGLLEVAGSVAGGHAYLLRGVRLRAVLPGEGFQPLEVVRLHNSWGDWGLQGEAYLKVDDLERLLKWDGECCIPVEPKQHRKQVEDVPLPKVEETT